MYVLFNVEIKQTDSVIARFFLMLGKRTKLTPHSAELAYTASYEYQQVLSGAKNNRIRLTLEWTS